MICDLLLEKYPNNPIDEDKLKENYLEIIKEYLEEKGLRYNNSLSKEIELRKFGKKYTISDHIRGMVYSMLSNQAKWYRIEQKLPEIDKLFFYYDPNKISETDPSVFVIGLFDLKCGNISTKAQMNALSNNIQTFKAIEKENGDIDTYILSDKIENIVQQFSDNRSLYKLKGMGEALVWEYLRNVGIDGAKPDTHLRRFFGNDRKGKGNHSPATISETYNEIDNLSELTGMLKVEIDNLIWSFCADGFGEICTAKPNCGECPIRSWCNR